MIRLVTFSTMLIAMLLLGFAVAGCAGDDLSEYRIEQPTGTPTPTKASTDLGVASVNPGATPSPTVNPRQDLALIPLASVLGNGKVTFAEFGRGICTPCKAMKPILEDLARDYGDVINVVIVEVDQNKDLVRQHGIMAIPTQLIFDANGDVMTTHIGYWAKDDILVALRPLGIE